MGCTSSKSTPTVENVNGATENDTKGVNAESETETMGDKIKDMAVAASDKIDSMGNSMLNSIQGKNKESDESSEISSNEDTATMQDDTGQPVMRVLSVSLDEDNTDGMVQIQESETTLTIKDPEEPVEKPLTPMPEDLRPPSFPDSGDQPSEESRSTPLDPISEENRFNNIPIAGEAAVVEILTIEIAELPTVDEGNPFFTHEHTNVQEEVVNEEEKEKEEDEKKNDNDESNN